MIKYLVLASSLALSTQAVAQSKPFFVVGNLNERYDGTDLGKAMSICAQHKRVAEAPSGYAGPPPKGWRVEYLDGWESCNDIHAKWEKSQAAQDKSFVEGVAKGK
jgi:hypothetical protein